MIRIAICDDKVEQLEIIKDAVFEYFLNPIEASSRVTFEVFCYSKVFDFLEAAENTGGFDIALLDICMPGMLGTDAAKTLRMRKQKTEIVFLTTSDEFAVDAFSIRAAHYILKPFSQATFDGAMSRVMQTVLSWSEKLLLMRLKSGLRNVLLSDILYIESSSHNQTVYLVNGENDSIRKPLNSLLAAIEKISPNQFVSPCKGIIVNQHQIKTITENGIVIKSGAVIPIAQRNFRKTKDGFFDFVFGAQKQE